MAVTPYVHDGAVLTADPTQQGDAVPALTKRIIKAATLVNPTAAPIAANLHLVKAGAAATAANVFVPARPIAAGESYPCPEVVGQGLNPGGFVAASGNGLVFKFTATDFV